MDNGKIKLTMSGEVLSRDLSLEKAIEITHSLGIQNFELWAQNCKSQSIDAHPRLYKNRDVARSKKIFEDCGIHVACVAFGGAFHPEIVQDARFYSEELIRSIEVAAEMGANYVNHYCNLIAPQFEINFEILDRYFAKALERAETLGVVMVLENEAHDMTHTPENVLAIIKHFNSDYFRASFDVTNFYQAGNEAFPYSYELLKEVIGYVHIKNGCIFNPNANHDQCWKGGAMTGYLSGREIYYTLPDQGAVNIQGLIGRLQSDHYDGYITLEPHSSLVNVLVYYQSAVPYLRNMGVSL